MPPFGSNAIFSKSAKGWNLARGLRGFDLTAGPQGLKPWRLCRFTARLKPRPTQNRRESANLLSRALPKTDVSQANMLSRALTQNRFELEPN